MLTDRPTPYLPDHDPDPVERQRSLDLQRSKNEWGSTPILPGLAVHGSSPPLPSPLWVSDVATVALEILLNQLEIAGLEYANFNGPGLEYANFNGPGLDAVSIASGGGVFPHGGSEGSRLWSVSTGAGIGGQAYVGSEYSWLDSVSAWSKSEIAGRLLLARSGQRLTAEGAGASLEAYKNLFKHLTMPQIGDVLPLAEDPVDSDLAFGWLRVAGPQPDFMRPFEGDAILTEAIFQESAYVQRGDTLAGAIREGRIFVCDYSALSNLPHASARPLLPIPNAYFLITATGGPGGTPVPMPVAIALGTEVFTPSRSDYRWVYAKQIVQIADLVTHELGSHLGKTHLLMEGIFTAMLRTLAPRHPIAILLAPHLEGTFFINENAVTHLIQDGGPVDELFPYQLGPMQALAAATVRGLDFKAEMYPNRMAAAGLADGARIPFYPYRNAAEQLWSAIREWVESYLHLYYLLGDSDVVSDVEIQSWAIAVEDHVGVSGFGGGIDTVPIVSLDILIDIVTMCIFQSSVQHAAVNYPQQTTMSPAAVYPFNCASLLDLSSPANEEDWLATLPTLADAEAQLAVLWALGGVHYTKLGEYDRQYSPVLGEPYFEDSRVKVPLSRFQSQLRVIAESVSRYPTLLSLPYSALNPEGIPQSINI